MAQPPYIQFLSVTKAFNKHVVLDNLSLDIPYGEITGIIGSSGSGKTTILNILIGFIKQDSGKILFQSREVLKDITNVSTIFGFASQGGSFYHELNVQENLMYFGKLYGLKTKDIKKRIDYLLKTLELEAARKTYARSLSTGMARRLDIACALIHTPKVLILDEPTEELDPLLRKELIKTLKKIRDDGTTIILSSHLLGELESLCDKIAILKGGKIVKMDNPTNLKKEYKTESLDEVFEIVMRGASIKNVPVATFDKMSKDQRDYIFDYKRKEPEKQIKSQKDKITKQEVEEVFRKL